MGASNLLCRVGVSLAVLSCFALLDALHGRLPRVRAAERIEIYPATSRRPGTATPHRSCRLGQLGADFARSAARQGGVSLVLRGDLPEMSPERWKELLPMAQKYEGKPVVFIAINSGTSRGDVEQYARDVGVNWPIIVDSDRSFEKQSDIGTISLQNIFQPRIIKSDGRWAKADWENLEPGVDEALKGGNRLEGRPGSRFPAAARDAPAGRRVRQLCGCRHDRQAIAGVAQARRQSWRRGGTGVRAKEIDKCASTFAGQDLERQQVQSLRMGRVHVPDVSRI